MKRKHIYIFFLFFFILWRPFHLFIFPFDGGGRMYTFLAIVFVIIGGINIDKSFYKNGKYLDQLFFLWVLWANVNTIFFNPVINPNIESAFVFFQRTSIPFIIYYGIRLNFNNVSIKKQWGWFHIALIFYLGFVVVFDGINSETNRLGNYLNSNQIAWIALLVLFSSFIIIKKRYLHIILTGIVFILIVMTASKKALLSFLFFFGLKYLLSSRMSIFKRVSVIAVLSIIIAFMTPILMKNTYLGERIQRSVEKNQNAEDDSELFDGRANFYLKGIEFLEDRPLVGIGLTNFLVIGDMDEEAHSEYVIQFAELGVIGFILFLLFHFELIKRLISLFKRNKHSEIPLILLISFFAFYGMFLGRWVYDDIPYNIFLALTVNTILSYNRKLKIRIENK